MHIKVDFKNFKKVIQSIQITLQKENNILLTANKDTQNVFLEAGYNGIFIKRTVKTEVLESGSLSIDSTFLTGLRLVGEIELKKEKNDTLSFKCDKFSGKLKLNQEIASSGIEEEINTTLTLNKKDLLDAIKKVNFLETNTQEGINIKINPNYLSFGAFDRIKMALYKENSPIKEGIFDILVNPSVITKIIFHINENKINIGIDKAIIKVETSSFLCYFPTIQMEPENLEEWLEEVPIEDCLGTIAVITENLLETVKSAHSISGSAKNYDLKLLFKIKDNQMEIISESSYGKANALLNLLDSDIEKLSLVINSQHLKEMLELIKVGTLTIKIWNDYIILYCLDNKYTVVIPLISDNIDEY